MTQCAYKYEEWESSNCSPFLEVFLLFLLGEAAADIPDDPFGQPHIDITMAPKASKPSKAQPKAPEPVKECTHFIMLPP